MELYQSSAKALHEALYTEALHEALRIEALHEALRMEALHEAPHEALRMEALCVWRLCMRLYTKLCTKLLYRASVVEPSYAELSRRASVRRDSYRSSYKALYKAFIYRASI